MDLDMPVMTGTEATREIRKLSPAVPIVAVSAYTANDDIDGCFQSGMNDYCMKVWQAKWIVPKPFRLNELLKVLVRWLSDDSQ